MKRGIGSRVGRWLVVAAMCALPVQGFAFTVNTNDIVNGAVTTPKIADGAVTTQKLADGAVTSSKLGFSCGSGQMLLFNGSAWVCSAGIAGPKGDKGDKGDPGIQGIQGVKGDKGDKGDTGLTGAQGLPGEQGLKGDKGDTGATGPAAQYANVIVVAKSGGDFSSIQSAIDSVNPTAENPVLIKIMPGTYNENITTKQFVAIKGVDTKLVIITSNVGTTGWWNGTVNLQSNSPLENLTIENTSSGTAVVVNAVETSNQVITNCILRALNGTVSYGIASGNGAVSIKNTDIKVVGSDYAIGYVSETTGGSSGIVENCTISAEGGPQWTVGFNADSANVDIVNSSISGPVSSVWGSVVRARNSVFASPISLWTGGSFYGASSRIDAGVSMGIPSGQVLKLVNCYDGNYNPIPNQ